MGARGSPPCLCGRSVPPPVQKGAGRLRQPSSGSRVSLMGLGGLSRAVRSSASSSAPPAHIRASRGAVQTPEDVPESPAPSPCHGPCARVPEVLPHGEQGQGVPQALHMRTPRGPEPPHTFSPAPQGGPGGAHGGGADGEAEAPPPPAAVQVTSVWVRLPDGAAMAERPGDRRRAGERRAVAEGQTCPGTAPPPAWGCDSRRPRPPRAAEGSGRQLLSAASPEASAAAAPTPRCFLAEPLSLV